MSKRKRAILEKHKERAIKTIEEYYKIHDLPKGEMEVSDGGRFKALKNKNEIVFTVNNKLNGDCFLCISRILNDRKCYEFLEILKVDFISMSCRDPKEKNQSLKWFTTVYEGDGFYVVD
ncbi:hypothetical protein [Peptacetobacter sp. AB845]|uniref:hypothetical protein n=1 Tax=Peptacetobacter sp. AB845 TaxID=3388429 RepID=UPI0039C91820